MAIDDIALLNKMRTQIASSNDFDTLNKIGLKAYGIGDAMLHVFEESGYIDEELFLLGTCYLLTSKIAFSVIKTRCARRAKIDNHAEREIIDRICNGFLRMEEQTKTFK